MPKCLECGFEAPRLQWTHFKYKCTGNISSINEYKNKYPNSILVDEELAAKCKITKQIMIITNRSVNSTWNIFFSNIG